MGSLNEILTLINAFEGEDSNREEDKAPSEVTKQERESLIEKATEELEKSKIPVEESPVSSTEQKLPEVEKSETPVEEAPVSFAEQKLPEVEKSATPVEEVPVSSEKKIDIEAAAAVLIKF
ncbi:hypothetical protein PVL29_005309 [Vitis rotundifolia]|uniref:Uncharacterized protein n=1 Tax=Vitis rotundifolia TaxID=103349 RepID=A0AA39AAH1_VITRO|nr:hypothetical protein PVL29_005309 [Vitis rotundifolia]